MEREHDPFYGGLFLRRHVDLNMSMHFQDLVLRS